MAYVRLITPAATEPISLADAKLNMRVEDSDYDSVITREISEAREFIERRIQKKVATQTWENGLDAFPAGAITLPFGPVQSITSLKYDDAANVEQTFPPASYTFNEMALTITPVTVWPASYAKSNAIRILFVSGHASPAAIPQPVIAAIYLKISELYDGEDRSKAIHDMLTNFYELEA